MSISMESFSAGPVGARLGCVMFPCAVTAFGFPVAALLYYYAGGGLERERVARFVQIAQWDAKAEAEDAVDLRDFRVFTTNSLVDPIAPGLNRLDEDYLKHHGHRYLGSCRSTKLTRDEARAVATALEKLAVYNRRVYAEGMRRLPRKPEKLRGG